ncbi:winged helix-turn-helix transcriptional regulator, partial [Candidatus Woesearchaeota archaeon]|nr:winged helix-turn-helix transcriptional regulator [Candidatus Woesearchaeota archaeon]
HYVYKKKNLTKKISKKEDKDLEKIILIIKKHGKRITQKELRKEIPLSEAKISLMISELEDEGKIKRIKKGRGNIIVLQ